MLLGGARTVGGCEQVRPRQREALAEGAAAGVWGRKNRSPRVLECTCEHQKCQNRRGLKL